MLIGIVAASWACSTPSALPSRTLAASAPPDGGQRSGAAAATGSTPSPGDAGPPTAEPSSTSDTAVFEADSVVRVVEGPLRARSRPRVAGDSELLTPLLATGQKLFVLQGPERASGYDWYFVSPIDSDTAPAGWVAAAARDGTPWIAPAAVSCPQSPSLDDLAAIDWVRRVACYGGGEPVSSEPPRDFTFTDRLYWGPMCGDGGDLGHEWMAECRSTFYWGVDDRGVILAVPPSLLDALGDVEPGGSFRATVTAHLDDPAARTCSLVSGWEGEIDYALVTPTQVLWCRAFFVASSLVRV